MENELETSLSKANARQQPGVGPGSSPGLNGVVLAVYGFGATGHAVLLFHRLAHIGVSIS